MTAPVDVTARRVTAGAASIGDAPRTHHWVSLWWALSRKNFNVRYKRASLGVLWVVIQPALQAAVVAVVFQRVFRLGDIPHYPAFVLSGMLPWAYFSQAVNAATASVVENSALVKKVAVPRLLFPLASVGGIALAFLASMVVMVAAGAWSGQLGSVLWLVPAFVLQSALIAGIGSFAASFNVAFRDVRYAVESALIITFYATPVFYTPDRLPESFAELLRLNPMFGVLSLYRAATLGAPVDGGAVALAAGLSGAVLVAGVFSFHVRSRSFADLL